MHAGLAKRFHDIRSSYWFVPSLMAVSASALAVGLTAVDALLGSDWLLQTHWLLSSRPEGARSLLAAIAGSMITVAGVTFSVTISSVVYAASQFGPRLLTNFMQDRGNQITLGTFISAFVYCLLVLRTVRSEGPEPHAAVEAFVPQLATLGALGFAVAGVVVLIYFIHHVPATVHISRVIARIGGELNAQIERLYPRLHGAPGSGEDDDLPAGGTPDPARLREQYRIATPVPADCDGYLQHLHGEGLRAIATEHDLLVFVARNPGDFVLARRALVFVWPAVRLDQDVAGRIRACFAFGTQRTPAQDLMFLAQELLEIAARALSPGVNDPGTAGKCIDWLSVALANLARRRAPAAWRFDGQGVLRVVYRPVTFPRFAQVVCDGLRPYAKRDPNVALHLLASLESVAPDLVREADREALLDHARLINSACQEALDQTEDRAAVMERWKETARRLREPGAPREAFFSPSTRANSH